VPIGIACSGSASAVQAILKGYAPEQYLWALLAATKATQATSTRVRFDNGAGYVATRQPADPKAEPPRVACALLYDGELDPALLARIRRTIANVAGVGATEINDESEVDTILANLP